jgi:hypothetical protein
MRYATGLTRRENFPGTAAVRVRLFRARWNLAHDRSFPSEVMTIKETSYGIDPHYRCFGVAVWRRRILGSP